MISDVPRCSNTTQEESELSEQFATYGCFMLSQRSTTSFPCGDRKALVSIDSNCSRYMTGFCTLVNIQPCSILVEGAFDNGEPSRATYSGRLQLGQLIFDGTTYVPGLRETILSLGQLDRAGCQTTIF